MLICHERYVGFRCPECSSINIKKISIFDFSGNKNVTLGCGCNTAYASIVEKDSSYLVAVPCPACNDQHFFKVGKTALWSKKIQGFYCPITTLGTLCIGEYDEVVNQLYTFDKQTVALLKKYHIDTANNDGADYVDEDIMFESVEYIYSLIFSGKIFCSCGEKNFNYGIEPNRIVISCKKCGRHTVIMADCEQALFKLYNMDEIVLYK